MNITETEISWRSVLKNRTKTNRIILHHAAAKVCSVQQIDSWHKNNGWSGIGYHFFVRKNGEIYRGRPLSAVGAHAAGCNSDSVGVCAEGDYSSERTMPTAQKRALAELLVYLKQVYPNAEIKGHKEVGATGCPGAYYPLEEMKKIFYNSESEGLSMTQYEELKSENAELKKQIDELKVKTGYYNYIDSNMPESYKPTIQKLVATGKLCGNERGELMLTTDMMRILTVLDRQGIFK